MKIPRYYQSLEQYVHPSKVLVLFGPRQVGKTTLINDFLQTTSLKYKLDTGDDLKIQNLFESQDFERIFSYAFGYQFLVIDETQEIPLIGQGLKILVDHVPDIRIIVAGSSSFELSGQVGEPLTGRKNTLTLFRYLNLSSNYCITNMNSEINWKII